MAFYRPLTLALLTLLLCNCKQEKAERKKNAATNPAANQITSQDANSFRSLVTPQQLTPSQLTPITAAEIDGKINSENAFFNIAPTEASACDAETDKLVINATDKVMTAEGPLNLSTCVNTDTQDKSVTYTEFTANVLLQTYCDKGGLQRYNGKTLGQVSDSEELCPGGMMLGLQSRTGTAKLKRLVSGQEYFSTGNIYYEYATPDHRPCSFKSQGNQKGIYENCRYSYVSTFTAFKKADGTLLPQSIPSNSATFLNFNNVGVDSLQPGSYFSSGVVNFDMNNWHGTMTYSASNTPPRWTANGTGQKSGTFSYVSTGLALGGTDSAGTMFFSRTVFSK